MVILKDFSEKVEEKKPVDSLNGFRIMEHAKSWGPDIPQKIFGFKNTPQNIYIV